MITLLLATALQAASASPPDEGGSNLAEQMEALQADLSGLLGTLEEVAADLEAVEPDDTAGLAAAWTRTLAVNARDLSWFRVEDPLRLSAQLAIEFALLEHIISGVPDGPSAAYSIGYDFTATSRTSTGPDAPDDAETADAPDEETAAPFCDGGELETGEHMTDIGLPLVWERCRLTYVSDGPAGFTAMRYRLGDDANGSRVIVAIAAASDSAETRDAMMGPALRITDAMGQALMAVGPPPMPFQD